MTFRHRLQVPKSWTTWPALQCRINYCCETLQTSGNLWQFHCVRLHIKLLPMPGSAARIRCSCDLCMNCRRFFSTAISKIDLAAMLSSSSAPVQLAAVQASSLLSQHAETLPSTSLPCLVKLLQADGAHLSKVLLHWLDAICLS